MFVEKINDRELLTVNRNPNTDKINIMYVVIYF